MIQKIIDTYIIEYDGVQGKIIDMPTMKIQCIFDIVCSKYSKSISAEYQDLNNLDSINNIIIKLLEDGEGGLL